MRHGLCHLDRVGLSHRHIVIFPAECALGCRRRLLLGPERWGATDVFLEEGMLKLLGPVSCSDPVRVVAKAVTGTSDLIYSWVLGVKSLLSSHLGPIHS